jgi:predicted transcriptional regulator
LRTDEKCINVTNLVENLSINHDIPPSTLRWNLKKLVELGLIITGNSGNKGIPVKLTDSGKFVCKILS